MNYDILIENLKIFYDHNKKHINNYKIIDFPRITNILNKIKIAKYLAHIDYYLNYVDIELDKYINLNFGEFNFDENPEDNNITLEKIMNLPEINDLEVMDKMINDMINDMGNSDKNENINKALEKMINDMNVIQPPKLNRTQRRLAKKHK